VIGFEEGSIDGVVRRRYPVPDEVDASGETDAAPGLQRWFDDVAAAEAALTPTPPLWSWRFKLDSEPDWDGMFGPSPVPPESVMLRRFEVEILRDGVRVFWLRGRPDESVEPYAFIDEDALRAMIDTLNAAADPVSPPGVV
jgi:hypothetical protein